jgi:peptide/nickel transport system ATP-binding protein
VGESGCGKSVTARAILQVVDTPGRIVGGSMVFRPDANTQIDLATLHPRQKAIRDIRGKDITMIFQEPMSSLTPVFTAGFHIMEAVNLHRYLPVETIGDTMTRNIQQKRGVTKEEAREIAVDMLQKVGLPNAAQRVDTYPHQLSGGQRQRVMIAIALSTHPDLLIADEPTTALDVSIEAQILDLMRELQQTTDMAILFITHNMGVIAEMADDMVVMYMGKEVEEGSVLQIFENPKHPYTKLLLASIPEIGEKKGELATIKGMVPSPFNLPPGCVFHPRCPEFMPGKCDVISPQLGGVGENQFVRCLLYEPCWPDTAEAKAVKMKEA